MEKCFDRLEYHALFNSLQYFNLGKNSLIGSSFLTTHLEFALKILGHCLISGLKKGDLSRDRPCLQGYIY